MTRAGAIPLAFVGAILTVVGAILIVGRCDALNAGRCELVTAGRCKSPDARRSAVLTRLTDADLLRTFHIQGYAVTGLYAVSHVVAHFAMHYGQILYVTKLLRGESLGFYRELDQTGRSSPASTRRATT